MSNESLPLYRSVIDAIVHRIVTGDLKPGVMLPSETDLGAEMGVSQGTARKALIELEQRGIVKRQQGRGTFVATTTPESDHFHFFRLRREDGSAVAPLLESETISRRRANAEERKVLNVDDKQMYEINRVRTIDGKRIVREISVLPISLFPALTDHAPLPNAIYAFYQQAYGIAISKADETLRAALANAEDAAVMDVKKGAPLIEVRRVAIDISDRIVELRRSRYVTDDLHYDVRLR